VRFDSFGAVRCKPTVRHLPGLVLGTILLRPYVFVFFLWYLLGAVTKLGWIRTALFTAVTSMLALAAEASSARSGIPLGWFQVMDTTRGQELWLGSVPAFSVLLFTVCCWAGFQLAVLLYSPLEVRHGDLQVLDTIAIRRSPRVLCTAAVLVTALGTLLGPLRARGDRWFVGAVYAYPEGGLFFGVPATTFAGTMLVALLAIGIYQLVEPRLLRPTRLLRAGHAHLRFGGLVEPALYLAIAGFALAVVLSLDERLLALVGALVFVPLTSVITAHVLGGAANATPAEREAHRRDFPRTRTIA
jgi:uncharacterized membrane protein